MKLHQLARSVLCLFLPFFTLFWTRFLADWLDHRSLEGSSFSFFYRSLISALFLPPLLPHKDQPLSGIMKWAETTNLNWIWQSLKFMIACRWSMPNLNLDIFVHIGVNVRAISIPTWCRVAIRTTQLYETSSRSELHSVCQNNKTSNPECRSVTVKTVRNANGT